jgi:hypothetical protein
MSDDRFLPARCQAESIDGSAARATPSEQANRRTGLRRTGERAGSYHAQVLRASQIRARRSNGFDVGEPRGIGAGGRPARRVPVPGVWLSGLAARPGSLRLRCGVGLRLFVYRRVDSVRRIGGDIVQAALATRARLVMLAMRGGSNGSGIDLASGCRTKAHARAADGARIARWLTGGKPR